MKKADIQTKEDLDLMVRKFYQKLLDDEVMSPFFTQAVQIDFEEHFKILVSFWNQILFFTGGYSRNVMEPHISLNKNMKIEKFHMDRWLFFFKETVDELFAGDKADLAKEKANQLSILMLIKIRASENHGFVV